MTSQFEIAADALIEAATDAAKVVTERAETRLQMAYVIAERVRESGILADVEWSKCLATADIALDAMAEESNRVFAKQLGDQRMTGRDISVSPELAVSVARKMADRVVLGLTTKRDVARREREQLERQPGQPVVDATLGGILQNIEYRERGLAAPTGRDIDAPAPLMGADEIAARIADREASVVKRDYPAPKRGKR